MQIIKDKEPIFETEKYDVILVGTSIYGMLCNGFQGKMANKYPYIVEENDKQSYGDVRRLGTRITVSKEDSPDISLLYICRYPQKNAESIDYEALEKCLATAAVEFKGKKIMTTVIGSTQYDGTGSKRRVLSIMRKVFGESDVDVYDYKQHALKEEASDKRKQLSEMGITNKSKITSVLRKLYLLPSKP